MSAVHAFVLALIQGITEFLPISSSAHAILLPYMFGWSDQGLTFDIVTNAGSLTAVIVYFRRELLNMVTAPFLDRRARRIAVERGDIESEGEVRGQGEPPHFLAKLVVASIPVIVAGLLFYGWISTEARDPSVIAWASILFGLLLWLADHRSSRRRELAELGWLDAMLIGGAQALSLIPGTSRSGVTITAALLAGFTREDAAKFSFLMAIPVSLGALAHNLGDVLEQGASAIGWWPFIVGFTTSAVSAYVVIGWLLDWVRRQSLDFFVVYRVVLGLLILAVPLVA